MRHMADVSEDHIFIYTSPDKRLVFQDMGFFSVATTSDVMLMENQKHGIIDWLGTIKTETEVKIGSLLSEKRIGSIVMNCAPFTRGHKFLVNRAAAESSLLHLFF